MDNGGMSKEKGPVPFIQNTLPPSLLKSTTCAAAGLG